MLTQKQVAEFLALPEDKVSPWFFTGSGKNDFNGDLPSYDGVYEIQEYPDQVCLEPGPDFSPPTLFMEWRAARRSTLISVDPRVPSLQTMAGAGFTWRGLIGPMPFAEELLADGTRASFDPDGIDDPDEGLDSAI